MSVRDLVRVHKQSVRKAVKVDAKRPHPYLSVFVTRGHHCTCPTHDAAIFLPFYTQQARIQGLGDGGGGDRSGSFDSSGHRHSTSSSPTIKAPRRRGGKHLPPDLVYNDDDDDGGGDGSGDNVEFDVSSSEDSRSSSTSTADLPWCHDPSGVKEWLAEERVRREGRNTSLALAHGNGDLACRVDTRRGSCNSSYKGCVSWVWGAERGRGEARRRRLTVLPVTPGL